MTHRNDLFAHDLNKFKPYTALAEQMEKVNDSFIYSAEILVADKDGYYLGRLYHDVESDAWRWDTSMYGEVIK